MGFKFGCYRYTTVCHNGEKTLEIFIIQGRDTKIQCRSKQCQNHEHKDHDHKDHTLRRIKCERWDESGVIIYHQNNKKHQCSCRLCFSGMINTITNQGFHRICLHDEVCIELTTEQTEFSDIVSVCVHVIISVHRFLGGGLRVSTHFEGKYIINVLKDDLKKVFAVMLLCLQKICLLLHLRMTFISPLYPVTTHHHATRSQYCNALLSKVSSTNSRKIQSLMLENWSRQILDSLEDINFHGDAATVQVAIPGIKQMKSFSDHRNILEHYRAMVHAYFSEDCSVHSEGKQECMVENRHELLEKADTKRESEKNYDDNCDQFSDNIHSVLFPSLEIRSEQIVYPATQQLVLEPILNKFSTPESTPSKHETMAVEFLRLCTMHDYPSTSGPSLLRLAQAGFYYEGNGNELVCFSCNIRKGTWNYHDSPREIHQRMSPNCKFLSQSGDGNIPIPREESTQDLPRSSPWVGGEVMADGPRAATAGEPANNTAHLASASADCRDGQDQSVPPRRPMIVKHPEYANRATRLGSYANFPRHMKQHPADMTDAGFYYAGFGDCCRCYHCGIGLRNWDPEDNPWIEHARWSSECPYILKVKGQAFIDLVQEAARAAEMAQDEDSEGERDSVGSNGAVGSEKSGESNSSSGGSTGNSPASDDLVENNVAKTSEAIVSKGVSSGDSGFGSGSTVQAQPIKAPLRTAAAQSLIHDEKIKPKYVTAAIEDLVKAEGWGAFTKENIRKYLKINEENGKSAPSASNADPDVLKQQNKELKDLTVCKICLDEKVSIVFLPCGHLVACPQCAPALTKCPICRKNIKGTVRTNLVEKSAAK